jgi:hypothetical protein
VRKADKSTCPVKPRPDVLTRAYRGAWRFGGVPFLVLCAVLLAARQLHGLADFLFWLTAGWIVLIRYVEAGCSGEDFLCPGLAARRKWRRFAVLSAAGAAALYAAAKIAGRPPALWR